MNNYKLKNLIRIIGLSLLLTACGEEQTYFPEVVTASSSAKIKFVHAASDASGVNFFLNDSKISSGAAAGSTIAYASAFPTINYASIAGGGLNLKAVVPATASVAEIVLATSSFAVENDKYYSVLLAGVSPNYETILLSDDLSSVAFDGQSYVRFANLIHNSTNKLTVSAKLGAGASIIIAQNLAFKESSAFIAIPPGDYTIELKDAVTNMVLASASATNKLLGANRIYTLFARGQMGQTGAKVPTLERVTNQ